MSRADRDRTEPDMSREDRTHPVVTDPGVRSRT